MAAFYQTFASAPRCVGKYLGKDDNLLPPVRTSLLVSGDAGVTCEAISGRLNVLNCECVVLVHIGRVAVSLNTYKHDLRRVYL